MREKLLLKTGWMDFRLEADHGILMKLIENDREDATGSQRDGAIHLRAFLNKLLAHVMKRGRVTFGTLSDITYKIAIAIPSWWYGEVPPSILEPLGFDDDIKLLIDLVPEPVCCLGYFFNREKKHMLSNTGAESLVYHCSMDDQFTEKTITSLTLTAKGSSRDVQLDHVQIHGFSISEVSIAFRELLQQRLELALSELEETVPSIYGKLEKIVDDFLKFLPRFDGTKDCKLRLPLKLPDALAAGIKTNQITFEASFLREKLFKKLLSPLCSYFAEAAEGADRPLHVLCSGILSECPYITLCATKILEEKGVGDRVKILNTLNGETSVARGAAIHLDKVRQHTQVVQIGALPENRDVFITMTSSFENLARRINALLETTPGVIKENEAKVLRLRAQLLIQEHKERFRCTNSLLQLFAYVHKLYNYPEKDEIGAELRREFDIAARTEYFSHDEAKCVDLAFCFYKHGATVELLEFLRLTGSSVSGAIAFDGAVSIGPVHIATRYGQREVLKWLLQNNAKLDHQTSDGSTCLHEAIYCLGTVRTGRAWLVFETLLAALEEEGVQKTSILNIENNSGETILDIAKARGLIKEYDILRSAGAQENSRVLATRQEIVRAIENDDEKHLEKVLREKPDILNEMRLSDGMTLLHLAVKQRNLNCTNMLLRGAKSKEFVNAQDANGWSALHLASALEDLNIAAILIQNNADLETSSQNGYGWIKTEVTNGTSNSTFQLSKSPLESNSGRWRPLHIASILGSEAITKLLVENGAELHSEDCDGFTPLRRAILMKNTGMARTLLEHMSSNRKIDELASENGSTPKRPLGHGALTDAASVEDEEMMELLLDRGWDVNEQVLQSGWTALSYAVNRQNVRLVARLLQKGADPKILHYDGSSLLHLAAEGQNVQLVRELLPRCSALVVDQQGATALHAAARKGFSPTAKLLVTAGIDVNAPDRENRSALYVALENSNLPVAQLLFEHSGQSLGGPEKTLLHAAVHSGNPWALKMVLSQKSTKGIPLDSVDDNGDTLLCIAAKAGHAKMVQELLRLHRPQNLWRPILQTLFTMAETGNDAILKVIVHHDKKFLSALNEDTGAVKIANIDGIGAVSKSSWTVLHAAVWYAQPTSVEVLLGEGAKLHSEAAGLTPLGLLCVTPRNSLNPKHLEVCEVLLRKGADVSKGGLGHPALHLAAKAGHTGLLEPLRSAGAVVSAMNGHGQTALQCAIEGGHGEVVSRLVEKGATLDPLYLHTAVHTGSSLENVKMLIELGIDANCVAPDGFTPLLVASAIGRVDIVNYLLANGANIQFRNGYRNQSALDMAVISRQLVSVTAILDSPAYSTAFQSDRSYAWTAASKDTSPDAKIYKYILERTDCQKDHASAILHWAILNENEPLVHLLVNNGVDLATPSTEGWSALHTASMAGKIGMMQLILNKGVGINYQGHKSRTALHQAIAANQPTSTSFLLEKGADTSLLDEDLQNYINIALDYSAIDALPALKLQPNQFTEKNYGGKTLVALAADSENTGMLRALLTIEGNFGTDYTTSFHQAVSAGDVSLVKKLLGCGAELNRKDFRGASPLREAVMQKNQTIASMLLESGADIESKCILGMTPLAFAAKSNDIAMTKLLISHGANVNATETKNECPVLVAVAWRGHVEIITLLLQYGCDVSCRTSGGSTALHLATIEGHEEVMKVLVQSGAQIDVKDSDGNTSLYLATENTSDASAAQVLLELGANTELKSNTGFTPLMNATLQNRPSQIKALLKYGAKVNTSDDIGRLPIMAAVTAGSEACIQLLIDHGARLDLLDKRGYSVLHYAFESGDMEIIKNLLAKAADINNPIDSQGLTLLHRAAADGQLDFVKYLLEAGAKLDVKTKDGDSVLITACSGKEDTHVEVVRFLIAAGQDCDAGSPDGRRTPLRNAIRQGNLKMTRLLIEHGATVNTSLLSGQSVLHEAAASGSVALLDLLLSYGYSLATATGGANGDSILHSAADNGQEETVLAIAIQVPELIDKPNALGESPLQRAVLKQHIAVVKLLCDLGAALNQVKEQTRETLMHLAARSDPSISNGELIKYLSDCGVPVYSQTHDGLTPLTMAVMHDSMEAVTAILDCGAKIDEFDFVGGRGRALDVAVKAGLSKMVSLLVSRGASLKFLDARGNPILDTAVIANNESIVRIILEGEEGNFSINGISSDDGLGPLHKAVSRNNAAIATLLLQYGANGNLRTGDGRTALQIAASLGHGEVADALYKSGKVLDTDFRDRNGNTALMLAARRGDTNFIRNLMAHHEHLATPSPQWDEAASAAAEDGHFDVVQLFIDMRDVMGWQQ
ncbi:hypothetical protein NLG97_g718 [Lecanicillium saksenae]|uniref:Uncharacterized protein n=1 Tax=Lecanicillium saksenae TaxID=468837 RepID=A0ACC1R7Q4_9HYPO|nr:hypothetical protein NLG97_g718 [Lecanicillium saksenae]